MGLHDLQFRLSPSTLALLGYLFLTNQDLLKSQKPPQQEGEGPMRGSPENFVQVESLKHNFGERIEEQLAVRGWGQNSNLKLKRHPI